MTYKEKFEASEHLAHYKNIATKIIKEMTVLRSLVESSPIAPRRWVWELIQNAKDVHPSNGVKIQIEYNPTAFEPHVKFRHNGEPFTADNIRFLIEQISTKERKKDEDGKQKTTGKFGTGFLTTHLLSEIVTVTGVAKEPDLDYRKFQLELDRSGFELEQITDAVERAKVSVENLDDSTPYTEYISGDFNTEFRYPLIDEISLKVAVAGLGDLDNCLPYTLAFVKEIHSVEVLPTNYLYQIQETKELDENIYLSSILIKEPFGHANFQIVLLHSGYTSLAIPVKLDGDVVTLLPLNDEVPRLFCSFPLIGAEVFPFPTIINNPNFNPTDPRDGVFLTIQQRANPLVEENKQIIKEAVQLYFQLLDYAVSNNWKNLHLLAKIRGLFLPPDWLDEKWFNDNVLNPIREKLLYKAIVETADGTLASILNPSDKTRYIWFPYGGDKKTRKSIWHLSSNWFPHRLPQESDIELWHQLVWKDCGKLTIDQLAEFIESKKNITDLSEMIKGEDVFGWLNEFYELLKSEKTEYDAIINKRAIFPNQNGIFCKKKQLSKDEGNIGDDFKDILSLLNRDIRNGLADEKIEIDFEKEDLKNQSYAVKEIISEINDKANDREKARSYMGAFKKLLSWFQKYPDKAKSLFPTLYKNKHLLYDDDEILENIAKAEQMNDLLKDFKVGSLDELRALITQKQDSPTTLLPVTEKILASMGISSLEEWAEAIKDKNLFALFSHESTPTTDMFVYAQSHIKQARENIIKHLRTLPNYDLTYLESTALTILAGLTKDGLPISIVTRPAYKGEVIIYYGSEQDILDFEPSELWIDDGAEPKKISLGHILKTAKIVKFPI